MYHFSGRPSSHPRANATQTHYFIQTTTELSPSERAQLTQLLGDGVQPHPVTEASPMLLVMPRIGTISPWSSKATDIAKVCGLQSIQRIERGISYHFDALDAVDPNVFFDRMTESVLTDFDAVLQSFQTPERQAKQTVPVIEQGKAALQRVNISQGLALSDADMDYLEQTFKTLQRDPTLSELMMFGQVNSEHCRHKIFNASWTLDNQAQDTSLFAMIKNTYKNSHKGVLSAYHDNAAVIQGHVTDYFYIDPQHQRYCSQHEPVHSVIKVETHNHPTAISPFAGAATGAGGEIRDEGATGIGARPKAGLVGFSVSNLHIPNFEQPWEVPYGKPDHIASPLDIMLEGPIGAASFNNEFGRPNVCGYFRSFEQNVAGSVRGYHKPIMIAGGLGNARESQIHKRTIEPDMKLIVLGGPAMQIGLGGGAASSLHAGVSEASLDYASVQRANPEMQRRAQQVINRCVALGTQNPIVSIHDVGAGGLSNAMPELVHDSGLGGEFDLRAIPNAEPGMAPMAIWCNEAQERYVLAIEANRLAEFHAIAERERCPYGVIGTATAESRLQLIDPEFQESVIDLPMATLFHDAPKLHRDATTSTPNFKPFQTSGLTFHDALQRVLHHPTVASKQFLITIGDRSVTGLVARDQMVGPWQVPVADVAVTLTSYTDHVGEAMAMGERAPVALLNPKASARLAISEAITNILAADVRDFSDIKLSANWMAAAGDPKEEADLYAAVQAVGLELCPDLNITVPVGKDSLSMRMTWEEGEQAKSVTSPVSLVISAFAPVTDVRNTKTPELVRDKPSEIWLLDLGAGQNRLGGSILAQVYCELGAVAPDLDHVSLLQELLAVLSTLRERKQLYSYHDRSDGGMIVTLLEMAFASHCGLDIHLQTDDPIREAFSEELGVVVQIAPEAASILQQSAIPCHKVADITQTDTIRVRSGEHWLLSEPRHALQKNWTATSYHMQSLRDNPECAQQEFAQLDDPADSGLYAKLSFELPQPYVPAIHTEAALPRVAILREQGVNGHVEMAAAFTAAGFECVDVHMTDILSGRVSLDAFHGLAACGGFSYGDVLGAGRGWGNAILMNERAKAEFSAFFHRSETFTLGVCNGCQMLSTIQSLIPGAEHWPRFVRNTSNQFEARLVMVRVTSSPSVLFEHMAGSEIPVIVAHGEGRVEHAHPTVLQQKQLVTLEYVQDHYPANPNGSPLGITGLCSEDGRVNIMMPHPERVFRTAQFSWHPPEWPEFSPWLQMFKNARARFDT